MGLILRFFYTPSPQLDRVYRLPADELLGNDLGAENFAERVAGRVLLKT